MGGNCASSCTFQICDFISHKKSLDSYNLICFGLQVNFKKGPGKFFHICIYSWFRSTMMGCAIGVQHEWEGFVFLATLSKSVILFRSKSHL